MKNDFKTKGSKQFSGNVDNQFKMLALWRGKLWGMYSRSPNISNGEEDNKERRRKEFKILRKRMFSHVPFPNI